MPEPPARMIPFIELSFYELSNIEWARGEEIGEWGEGDLRFVIYDL